MTEVLLPPWIQAILKRGVGPSSNIFVLHSCGSVVQLPQPCKDLEDLANSGLFQEIIAFDQECLQPGLSYGFMTDACRVFFVVGQSSMTCVLPDHHWFGAHTGLVLFTKDATTKFIWAHPVKQLFGEQISNQCSHCQRVQTFQKIPNGAKWFDNQPPGEDRHGTWLLLPVARRARR
ncbi:hypothetical protein BKA70DRAFT_1215913 [Coprinopsis sp. MPI-PUGE-AT-0042]|nr:hypothetical protein BKA70DRAFT_1215913 [Coprinopsis sp. MPI-PUGE-AT-0042]